MSFFEVLSRTHLCVAMSASLATSSGPLCLKHSLNDLALSLIWMSGVADTWMTSHERMEACCFFLFYYASVSHRELQLYLIWLQQCLPPETPEVFCGLKHVTHLSICIVVSRLDRSEFSFFLWTMPLKAVRRIKLYKVVKLHVAAEYPSSPSPSKHKREPVVTFSFHKNSKGVYFVQFGLL